MFNVLNYISYAPKRLIALFASLVLVAVPIVANASWSPSRPTFSINKPADYVTFNSITDNPNYGDERTFFDVKPASNTNTGGFKDTLKVQDGQELLLRTYVHNNAKESLNTVDKNGDGKMDGIARNTRVRVLVPTGEFDNLRLISYISADNAKPGTVSDTVDLVGDQPFKLSYVKDSATMHNNARPNGVKLSNDIVKSSGAKIGWAAVDGDVPGCFAYTSFVTLKVKVQMQPNVSVPPTSPNVSIDKFVRVEGQTEWKTENTAKKGDTLDYRITVKNTGPTELRNVMVRDSLPPHMTYVNGSTKLYNSNNPNGLAITNDNLTKGGINIGHYASGANAHVTFKVKINDDLKKCGDHTFKNVGIVKPEGMNEFYNTTVTRVNIKCVTPEEPEQPEKPEKPEKPVKQPKELPNTGVGSVVAGVAGSGSLGVAIRSYLVSRRRLSETLLDI